MQTKKQKMNFTKKYFLLGASCMDNLIYIGAVSCPAGVRCRQEPHIKELKNQFVKRSLQVIALLKDSFPILSAYIPLYVICRALLSALSCYYIYILLNRL
jgi:hypothetical protein